MNPPLRAEARPPGADRGPALGRARLHRHRPRAALARGEGGAVRAARRWASPASRPRSPRCTPSLVLPGVLELALLVERMTAGGRAVRAAGAHARARRARANLVPRRPGRRMEVGEAGYESRSANSCFAGRRLRGRVRMTVAAGVCGIARARLRDPARRGGRPAARSRPAGDCVKLRPLASAGRRDRRAGGVSPGGARLRAGGAQHGCRWSEERAGLGVPGARHASSTRRASATPCRRWPSTWTGSRRSRRSASRRSPPTAFDSALAELERDQVLLCGIESHVCVNQTADDLLAGGVRGSRRDATRSAPGPKTTASWASTRWSSPART